MKMNPGIWLLFALLGALFTPSLAAQSSDDGPALGVARLSLLNGSVSVERGDSGDWVQAEINLPLVEGDTIRVEPGSRAEVQLDYSNLIRIQGPAEVVLGTLGSRNFVLRVAHGTLTYSELRGGESDVDIETPQVAVRPMKNGSYRIEVAPEQTAVTVRKGEAEIVSPDGIERLDNGKTMLVRDSGAGLEFRSVRADPKDDWDRFNEDRDKRLSKSDSYRYVSRSVYGADDLDDHGDWRYVSGYGHCWYPREASGWAPYRNGRWAWLDYYGWSWVGYEPWGWAPYHYGNWFYNASYGWGWNPGSHYAHHTWRPALVSFFGYNSGGGWNFGVGLGFGNIGWVPLAPGEPYYPWYGRHFNRGYGGGGIRNSTIIVDNSVNIYNNYRNARVRDGVTIVDAQSFSRGLVDSPTSLRGAELRRATSIRGQIPVVPARDSQGRLARSSDINSTLTRGGGSQDRTFFSRGNSAQSPRVDRVSFNQQRDQIASSVRQFGVDRESGRGAGTVAGSEPASGGVRSATAGSSRGTSGRSRDGVAPTAGAAPSNSGVRSGGDSSDRWRQMGESPSANSGGSAPRLSRSRSGDLGAGSNAGTDTPSSGVRSSRGDSQDRGNWRTFGREGGDGNLRSTTPSRSRSGSSGDPSGVSAPSDRQPTTMPRSRIDPNAGGSRDLGGRSGSEQRSAPSSTPTPRIDRSRSGSRATGRDQSSSFPDFPSRSRTRAPSASARESSSSPSNGGGSFGSTRSAPSMSPPRGSRAPSVSSPRNSGGGIPNISRSRGSSSSPSVSRPAPSQAPSVRSAPSSGGGGGVRSAPSSGGGSVRSAPGRGGGRGRSQ